MPSETCKFLLLLAALAGSACANDACPPLTLVEEPSDIGNSMHSLMQTSKDQHWRIRQDIVERPTTRKDLPKGEELLSENGMQQVFATASGNLCIGVPGDVDHLVPEFMLIGTEKAATTSFWIMFLTDGIVKPHSTEPPYEEEKELHSFNSDNFDLGVSAWLQHFPECSDDQRLVAIDFSPTYLRDERCPLRIKEFYGEESTRIKFGVILRNPIDRMHSAFHFYRQAPDEHACQEALDDFQVYVQNVLSGVDPCGLLETGDYAVQLQRYFGEFDPEQFTVFLFHDVVNPTGVASAAIVDIWHDLGLQGSVPEVIQENSFSHSSLVEDLDENTTHALQQYVADRMGSVKVAQALLEPVNDFNRPLLVGFNGSYDEMSVISWIEKSW